MTGGFDLLLGGGYDYLVSQDCEVLVGRDMFVEASEVYNFTAVGMSVGGLTFHRCQYVGG